MTIPQFTFLRRHGQVHVYCDRKRRSRQPELLPQNINLSELKPIVSAGFSKKIDDINRAQLIDKLDLQAINQLNDQSDSINENFD
ncbi:MAG: hypothetical protein EZS28_000091 [Streblomastix strix]|uniref:Uncharacterized protein n=1 Tax=Streblomastix strix TaxID=222440 RepID=A0A5J4XB75_9EUKA|nr:MAG: hypothetical protein EZS28_000091 [Streblomastix strix]